MFLYTALYFYCFYVYVVFMVGILKQNGEKNGLKKSVQLYVHITITMASEELKFACY